MKFGKLRSFKPGESRAKRPEVHAIKGGNPGQVMMDELMAMKGRVASRMDDLAEEIERTRAELKGKKDGNCNVTACQRPGAYFYNTGTRAYYCIRCARDIRHWGLKDGTDLFPDFEAELERARAEERARH